MLIQFIERTWLAVAGKSKAVRHKIIPGDRGKVGSGWLTRLLSNRSECSGEAEFTSSSGMVAHANCEMRDLAASRDEKPRQAGSSSLEKFRFQANRSHPEGAKLLLCISTVRTTLAGENKINTARRKTPKGEQKERPHREEHGNSAGSVKNFRKPAMLKTTALDCETKGSLREKRRDPWFRANAPPKADLAVPEPVVKTRY
jgi:hypothetical protein